MVAAAAARRPRPSERNRMSRKSERKRRMTKRERNRSNPRQKDLDTARGISGRRRASRDLSLIKARRGPVVETPACGGEGPKGARKGSPRDPEATRKACVRDP